LYHVKASCVKNAGIIEYLGFISRCLWIIANTFSFCVKNAGIPIQTIGKFPILLEQKLFSQKMFCDFIIFMGRGVGDTVRDFVTGHLFLSLAAMGIIYGVGMYMWMESRYQGDEVVVVDSQKSDALGDIVVDVSGAVANPGVYTLPSGSRLVDLMDVSGGVSSDASGQWVSQSLNLSQKLEDSQKVYVPFEWDVDMLEEGARVAALIAEGTLNATVAVSGISVATTEAYEEDTTSGEGKINVNTASQEELETLSGVGPVTAEKIINNRSYSNLVDLQDKAGLSDGLLDKIKDSIEF
jgi:competence protein ComEA